MGTKEGELEKIAQEGRRLAAEREAARKAAAAEELQGKSREAERRRVASLSFFVRGGWILESVVVAAAFWAGIAVAIKASLISSEAESVWAFFLILLPGVVPGVLAYLLRPMIGRRALRRETEWLLDLPFSVSGYLECLSRFPRDGEARVALWFAGNVPDAGLLADVLHTIGAELKTSSGPAGAETPEAGRGGEIERFMNAFLGKTGAKPETSSGQPEATTPEAVRRFSLESGVSTNAHLRRWFHDLVGRCLVLHQTYPLARLEVKLSW